MDELRLEPNASLDGLERARRLDPVERPALQERQPPEDPLEGRAQLVRHGGQEVVLRAVGGFRFPLRTARSLLRGDDPPSRLDLLADVAEVADETEATVRQLDPIQAPFVV